MKRYAGECWLTSGRFATPLVVAATLWFVTVMGLCFGGGRLVLGLIATALAFFVLSVLKKVEKWVKQDRRATVRIRLDSSGPSDRELGREFEAQGLHIASWRVSYLNEIRQREATFVVHWRTTPAEIQPPPLIEELARRAGLLSVEWID